jgi:hypothetical protein
MGGMGARLYEIKTECVRLVAAWSARPYGTERQREVFQGAPPRGAQQVDQA